MYITIIYFTICSSILINTVYGDSFEPVILQLRAPLNFSNSTNIQCARDSKLFLNSLKNYTLWAYNVWDASAKLPIGLTEGSQYQLGNFDECFNNIDQPIKTQYCLATVTLNIKVKSNNSDPYSLNINPYISIHEKLYYTNDPNRIRRDTLFWGVCVPSTCGIDDVASVLQETFSKNENFEIFNVTINDNACNTGESLSFNVGDYFFCIIIFILITVTLLCTIIDVKYISSCTNQNILDKKSVKYCLCFSIKKNYKDLMKSESSNESLRVIYGIRVFMTFSVVIAHSLINLLSAAILNYEDIEHRNRSFEYILICRGDVIIDLFFAFSGLFCTYSYLQQSEKRRVDPLRSIILRYMRLAPVFIIVTFFHVTLYYKLASGPLWNKIVGAERTYCENNWWANLLFVSNYVDINNLCILQGWYISTDFQLFILAIPINMLIKKGNKLCFSIIGCLIICATLIPFLEVYLDEKEPILYMFNDFLNSIRQNDFFISVYMPLHTRASTFIMGMVLGYIYYKLKDSKFKLSPVHSVLLFTIGFSICTACVLSGHVFYDAYIEYKAINGALYASLHRPAFVIGASLMVFVCGFGELIILKDYLNWKGWIPIAKLSFNVYMVHWAIQLAHIAYRRTPVTMNIYFWIRQAIEELILSHIVAVFLYMILENPISTLTKELLPSSIIFKTQKRSQYSESTI